MELKRTNRGDRLHVVGVGSLLNLFRNSWKGDSWVKQQTLTAGSR